MTRLSRLLAAVAILSVPSAAAPATIGVVGSGNILVPNASPNTGMTPNFFNDTGAGILIHAWDELQNIILGSNIVVDFTTLGLHTGADASENAVITAGTAISSHYIYFDPLAAAARTATFEYDEDIIGIIVFSDIPASDRLLATDFLRNPLTVAPGAHFTDRGFEVVDALTLIDSRHIMFDLSASSPGNQVRVITRSHVPEPSLLVLMGTSLTVIAIRLRARQRRRLQ